MSEFYPAEAPSRTGRLTVGGGHELYFEESGRPDGVPVIYLHGGPGAGMEPGMRRFHDPGAYRFVMFDQRGAGLSRPSGEVRENTTQLSIADIEALRVHLGIERWIVSGGSWGSTLALAYTQAHPERCTAAVVRGVFLGTRDEMHWVYAGMRKLFPLEWHECLGHLSLAEQEQLHATIHARVFGSDRDEAVRAATALAKFEWLCASVVPDVAAIDAELTPDYALTYSKIVCHYVMNDFFLRPDQLIHEIGRIAHVPGYIVQGKCDWVCPPWSAVRLHRAWAGSRLKLVAGAGHGIDEPGIAAALLEVMEELKRAG